MTGRIEQATRWMYRGIFSGLVKWFRVPAEPPTLPVRQGEFVQSFPPDPAFLSYMKFWFWIVLLITDIAMTVGYVAATIAFAVAGYWWVGVLLFPIALFIIVAPDIVAYIAIHLRYDTMWYVMTDRSLRIRNGIWSIHEVTITFENVQNLKVQQGPLQRHYGIANLIVETAGAGAVPGKGGPSITNRGIIEGVSNAEELRERILSRLKQSSSAGLGDDAPETTRPQPPAWTAEHLAALREVRDEVRLLAAAS